jgi:hypothetical protein
MIPECRKPPLGVGAAPGSDPRPLVVHRGEHDSTAHTVKAGSGVGIFLPTQGIFDARGPDG